LQIYCLAFHCVISQQKSHECCSCCCCCCCCSWPCAAEVYFSLQSTGGSVSYAFPAAIKVEQQKQQHCNSWAFTRLRVCSAGHSIAMKKNGSQVFKKINLYPTFFWFFQKSSSHSICITRKADCVSYDFFHGQLKLFMPSFSSATNPIFIVIFETVCVISLCLHTIVVSMTENCACTLV